MGLIQDFIQRMKEKKQIKEGYARDRYIEEDYSQRKLSSNERELMRYQEEERQKRIKAALEAHRKVENDKIWSGQYANPAYAKNVIAGQKNLFSGKNMFGKMPNIVNNEDVVHAKNIFHNQKNIFGGKKK